MCLSSLVRKDIFLQLRSLPAKIPKESESYFESPDLCVSSGRLVKRIGAAGPAALTQRHRASPLDTPRPPDILASRKAPHTYRTRVREGTGHFINICGIIINICIKGL